MHFDLAQTVSAVNLYGKGLCRVNISWKKNMFHKRTFSFMRSGKPGVHVVLRVVLQRVRVAHHPESDGVHEEGAGLLPDLVPLHAVHTPAPPGIQQYWS